MKIIEVELHKGVNIQIWKDFSQKRITRWPYFKTVGTYTLEWQIPGSNGWSAINEFKTQKQAMAHLGKMIKASNKLEFKLSKNEQPRQAIQTTAL